MNANSMISFHCHAVQITIAALTVDLSIEPKLPMLHYRPSESDISHRVHKYALQSKEDESSRLSRAPSLRCDSGLALRLCIDHA
jgi:hypothetical protein